MSDRIAAVSTLPEHFNAAAFFVDRHLADGRGARTAFRVAGRAVTYADLGTRVNRVGGALAGLGVEIEDRVLLVLDDTPAFAAAFWGTVKIGGVAVPVNTLMAPDEYEFLLNDSRAKVAVVEARVAPGILGVRDRCPFLREIVVAGRRGDGGVALDDLLDKADETLEPARTFREDIMYWGYTSGSTGRPKAAVHSHKDFVAAADLVGVGIFGIGPDDLIFSASKMFFAFGLGNTLYFPARVGAASILIPERLEAERAFEVITTERPTVFFTVPTLYARMLQVPDAERRWDLGSLRLCVSSGEALPPALFDTWRARFGHDLVDVVGSTETLHDFIANRPGAVRRGSAGRLVPGFEARLVDDDGRPVASGTVGHLLIQGETTSPYYWNRLERTRTTMLGEWLRTGDMFWEDAEGYFYFAGRSDDMLKVGGLWVSPAEVEARLVEHPGVLEAGVIGRADDDGLVKPNAVVVLKPGVAASPGLEAELKAWVRGGLAPYKAPRWIEFVPELPKTATGKIQRFRLRVPARDAG
ncbi:MAG: benzoate-CoA ligase family protein [Candidatus Rokubacteria bacterium]|nr:benzoate-CoA ligase family protein [Candidatus Rokubacteria bacterium]